MALLTDFGDGDAYVGIMKGVILSRLPQAHLVDLTHAVPPQAVLQAAYVLGTAYPHFPRSTVFVCIVDPGVGTSRRRVAIVSGPYVFIGPDNGCLSAALPDEIRGVLGPEGDYEARPVFLPPEIVAVSVENFTFFRQPVSSTFEGRDVFAPCAAHLAAGGTLLDLGPRIDEVQALPAFRAPAVGGGRSGRIIHVDSFGNLITDIRSADVGETWTFEAAGRRLSLVQTYGDTVGPVAIRNSSGFVELAVAGGSAALELGLTVGDAVLGSP